MIIEHEMGEVGVPLLGQPNARNFNKDALRYAAVALLALIHFLVLFALQVYGLYFAVIGRRQQEIRVNWCSPAFRDFVVAITTGNCEKFNVMDSSSNGIGCISLEGSQQRNWLTATIIALAAAIIFQVLDAFLMWCTTSEHHWRGAQAQRPWFTIFGGLATLGMLIMFGVWNADGLPKDVTETVWIYRKEASRAVGRVCKGTLNPPGLRGVMIGYMDGLFGSWGSVYDGR